MGCLLTRCVYFKSAVHDKDDDILQDICDVGDDDDIDDDDDDDDNWSSRAVYGSVENNVGMIEFIYLSCYN
jgi:hypothetical protein